VDTNIAPTKTNLLAAKATLDFSKEGFELLDKKRNVLIREMMGFMDRAREIQEKMDKTFKEAYEALMMANLTLGVATVSEIAETVPENGHFDVLYKSVMGVEIPKIKYEKKEPAPTYSFFQTNPAMDDAFKKLWEIKYLVMELAEIETSVYRLAKEIKKTQKRANALENIQIPKYGEMVKYISDVLEEKDREDFYRLKVVKKKRLKKKMHS